MKSPKGRFLEMTEKYPYLSSFVCFERAIAGMKLPPHLISRWFTKLVEKDDYNQEDRYHLILHLREL